MKVENERVVSETLTTAKRGKGRPRKADELRKKSRTVMANDVQWEMVVEEAQIEAKEISTFVVEELMEVIKARRKRRGAKWTMKKH